MQPNKYTVQRKEVAFQFPSYRDMDCNCLKAVEQNGYALVSVPFLSGHGLQLEYKKVGGAVRAFQFPSYRDIECNKVVAKIRKQPDKFQFPSYRDIECNSRLILKAICD